MFKIIFKKITKKIRSKKGFTILETLVAAFILVLAITGPLVFAQTALRASFLARDQITAFLLAQDVIEYIKNERNQAALDNLDPGGSGSGFWLGNTLQGTCVVPGQGTLKECKIDTANDNITTCAQGGCEVLKLNENTGYNYQTGDDSRFTRTVFINQVESDQEAEIVIIMEWTSHVQVGERRIVVQENIYNWIPTN